MFGWLNIILASWLSGFLCFWAAVTRIYGACGRSRCAARLPGELRSPPQEPRTHFLIEMAKLWLVLPSESKNCRRHCSSPLPNVSESLSPARLPLIPICVGRGSGEAELSITPDESCRHNNNNNNSNAAVRNSHSLRPLRSLSSVLSQRTLLPERPRGLNYPRHKSPMTVMQVWPSDLWLFVFMPASSIFAERVIDWNPWEAGLSPVLPAPRGLLAQSGIWTVREGEGRFFFPKIHQEVLICGHWHAWLCLLLA